MKNNSSIKINEINKTITVIRKNVSKTNAPDTRYVNLKVGTEILIRILMKKGFKLFVHFLQYTTLKNKLKNRPKFSIKIEVNEFTKLGLRTKTKSGEMFFRYRLEKKDSNIKNIEKPVLSVGTLCSGMGSTPTALKEVNIDFDLKYSCEKDKHPQRTLKHNFDVERQYEDLFELDSKSLPYVDLLCAGFVCTSFSKAGKLKGFEEKQGTMIFKILEILQTLIDNNKAPKVVLLENVSNIARHDYKKGEYQSIFNKTFDKKIGLTLHIIETEVFKQLEKYYDITWSVENTLDYGIPHHRERWFCMLTKKSSKYSFDFSKVREKRVPLTSCLKDYLDSEKLIDNSHYVDKKFIEETFKNSGHIERVGSLEGVTYQQSKIVFGIKKSASCFTTGENGKYLVKGRVRILTINEKLDLQGFPKWYEFPSNVGKTARHKMLGNTISVNVMKNIFEVLFDNKNFKLPEFIPSLSNPINNTNYSEQKVS